VESFFTTWTLPSLSRFLVLVRHHNGGPAQLGQAPWWRSCPAGPVHKSDVQRYQRRAQGLKSDGEGSSKAKAEPISCEAVLIAPFLLGGHARANVGPCLTPLQQVCLLILPPYHIAQVFLFPLEALAVACNPRMVYRVVAPYHMHWLFWRSKQLGFTLESKQKENEIN
jgi:hypothetical protein